MTATDIFSLESAFLGHDPGQNRAAQKQAAKSGPLYKSLSRVRALLYDLSGDGLPGIEEFETRDPDFMALLTLLWALKLTDRSDKELLAALDSMTGAFCEAQARDVLGSDAYLKKIRLKGAKDQLFDKLGGIYKDVISWQLDFDHDFFLCCLPEFFLYYKKKFEEESKARFDISMFPDSKDEPFKYQDLLLPGVYGEFISMLWKYGQGEYDDFAGMPACIAYELGFAFYCGRGVTADRALAHRLLSYAFFTGSPQARVAYALFFINLDPTSRTAFLHVYDIELNALHISFFMSHHLLTGTGIPVYLKDGQHYSFEDELLNNLAAMVLAFNKIGIRDGQHDLSDMVSWLIRMTLEKLAWPHDLRLNAALIELLGLHIDDSFYDLPFLLDSRNLFVGEYTETPEDAIKIVLKEGLKKKDAACMIAWCASPEFKISDKKDRAYLKRLSDLGYAQASFSLALYERGRVKTGTESPESAAVWETAARQGFGYAAFNQALVQIMDGDLKSARENAVFALRCGIMYAYFALYKIAQTDNPQLACTYLRYAAEYLCAPAVRELEELKKSGRYKPLPFMEIIEEIEALAEKSPAACLYMGRLYGGSGLLPPDPFKTLEWERRAQSLGDGGAVEDLDYHYRDYFPHGDDSAALRHMQHSLAVLMQLKPASGPDPQKAKLASLGGRIKAALEKGQTEFERELYINALRQPLFWPRDRDAEVDRLLKQGGEGTLAPLLSEYCGILSCYTVRLGNSFDEKAERRRVLLELLTKFKDRDLPLLCAAKALTLLRSVTQVPDFAKFQEITRRGAGGNDPFCLCFYRQSFDGLLYAAGIREQNFKQKEELPDDVFVLAGAQ